MRDFVVVHPYRMMVTLVICHSKRKRCFYVVTGIESLNLENLRTVTPVPFEELNNLHTGSLLARLKLLRSLQDSFALSDWLPEERDAVEAAGLIAFKETAIWKAAFDDVKRLLDEREHMPRGSKERRQQAAHQKQNR